MTVPLSTAIWLALGLVAIAYSAVKFPGFFLGVLAMLVLMYACSHAEAEPRFEISVIVERDEDRASADAAVNYAAKVLRDQLDIELVAVTGHTYNIAQHTHAGALLDAVKAYRFQLQMLTATDATVFFTRRTLTRGYEGIATVGPACAASSSAVVTLRDDGYDGQILAHELLHTLGVPHDHAAGYLMSEHATRAGTDYVSPDTVLTVKALQLDCMQKPVASSPVPAGTLTAVSGGGGSFDVQFAILFLILGLFASWSNYVAKREMREKHEARLAATLAELAACPQFSLRDVLNVYCTPMGDKENRVLITFTTHAGAYDFRNWLDVQHKRAKHNEESTETIV